MADRLTIAARDGLGIASVMARKGAGSAALGDRLGFALDDGPLARVDGSRAVIGTGPGTWLVVAEGAAPDHADAMAETVAGLASVSDQSSGYVVHRLSGPDARTILQRGAPIDFHPDAFRTGMAATTLIAHIGVILWQVDERPTYDVATFRSYASSFRHWLDQSAAAL